jgi:hypothetical protein
MRTLVWRASIALTDDLKLQLHSLAVGTRWLGDAVRAIRIETLR